MLADRAAPPTLHDLITSDPDILGGRRVFRGTRVPVAVLFENLADGMSVDAILDESPTLDKSDVVWVLNLASAGLAVMPDEIERP